MFFIITVIIIVINEHINEQIWPNDIIVKMSIKQNRLQKCVKMQQNLQNKCLFHLSLFHHCKLLFPVLCNFSSFREIKFKRTQVSKTLKLDFFLNVLQVYVAAGSVYSLEAELSDLEECARGICSSTSDMELSFLEEQVAAAAAKVQQSELQVGRGWISSRICK